MTSNASHAEQIAELHAEVAVIEAAMRSAVQDAIAQHKRAGLPLVVWEDGQVVLIPADPATRQL